MSYRQAVSIYRPDLFQNKVAIVTGGGTGIGKAIAYELALLGCNVIIASRKLTTLQATSNYLTSLLPHSTIVPIQCNIRKEADVQHLMSQTMDTYGKIDYLINNGGGQYISTAEDISLKGWEAVVQTNLTGTFLCCQHVYKTYMKQHGGTIVNITANITRGFPGMCHSGAARAGVENLTKSLAIEWASNGIRINCVAPGIIWNETAVQNYPNGTQLFDEYSKECPAQRVGTVEEVSAAVLYLLSPASSYTSGHVFPVDGAMNLYGNTWRVPPHHNFSKY